jgi:hypothetical protein
LVPGNKDGGAWELAPLFFFLAEWIGVRGFPGPKGGSWGTRQIESMMWAAMKGESTPNAAKIHF